MKVGVDQVSFAYVIKLCEFFRGCNLRFVVYRGSEIIMTDTDRKDGFDAS